jgi:hypothetical protein
VIAGSRLEVGNLRDNGKCFFLKDNML